MPGIVDVLLKPARAEGKALEVALEALLARIDTESAPVLGSDLRLLVKQCCRYPEEMRELLAAIQARAPVGAPRQFRATFEEMLDVLRGRVHVARRLIELVRSSAPAEEKSDHLEKLEAAEAELHKLTEHVASLWAWMNEAGPPLDRASADEAQAAFVREEHDDIQSLYDRVRAGERLEGN
jgi:hypothetical protein